MSRSIDGEELAGPMVATILQRRFLMEALADDYAGEATPICRA